MTVRERFAAWFASAAFTRGGCEERFLRNVAELAYLAAWSAAREEAVECCEAEVDKANENVKAWTMSGTGREAAAMVERYYAAEARTCAAAIRSRLDAASRDGGV